MAPRAGTNALANNATLNAPFYYFYTEIAPPPLPSENIPMGSFVSVEIHSFMTTSYPSFTIRGSLPLRSELRPAHLQS